MFYSTFQVILIVSLTFAFYSRVTICHLSYIHFAVFNVDRFVIILTSVNVTSFNINDLIKNKINTFLTRYLSVNATLH
jgi:hypothetical protein